VPSSLTNLPSNQSPLVIRKKEANKRGESIPVLASGTDEENLGKEDKKKSEMSDTHQLEKEKGEPSSKESEEKRKKGREDKLKDNDRKGKDKTTGKGKEKMNSAEDVDGKGDKVKKNRKESQTSKKIEEEKEEEEEEGLVQDFDPTRCDSTMANIFNDFNNSQDSKDSNNTQPVFHQHVQKASVILSVKEVMKHYSLVEIHTDASDSFLDDIEVWMNGTLL
tara:strand:- start:592 stop:1254 length:663 start_codon:yes stop_codon:yes gene_type:complete